jgi:hypothetical protein
VKGTQFHGSAVGSNLNLLQRRHAASIRMGCTPMTSDQPGSVKPQLADACLYLRRPQNMQHRMPSINAPPIGFACKMMTNDPRADKTASSMKELLTVKCSKTSAVPVFNVLKILARRPFFPNGDLPV